MRTVPEWQGKTDDTAPPKLVKARLLLKHGGRCALTGHKFRPGDVIQFDHVLALGLGGENREANLAPVLAQAHAAKTADDTRAIRKADRVRLKHMGQWPASPHKIQSKPFQRRQP